MRLCRFTAMGPALGRWKKVNKRRMAGLTRRDGIAVSLMDPGVHGGRMPSKRKIVMLVDDDEEFLCELEEALALSGFVPVPLTDGAEAPGLARRVRPDAILLDLKLGGEDGYTVAGRLRRQRATARIPIILMSGYFGDPAQRRALPPSNINIYLSKPFNQKDVVKGIQTVLAGKNEEYASDTMKGVLLGPRHKPRPR